MSRSYVELAFRHKYVLILPILIAFAVGTIFAFRAPREYVASASVWTDTRVPNDSTVGTSGGQDPPSAGQAALLSQLLATRDFLRDVVEISPFAADFRMADRATQSQILGEVSSSAYVATPGPQLLTLSVARDDPDEATGIASAILTQFEQAQLNEATMRAKEQAEYDRRRLDAAKQLASESSNRAAQELYADAAQSYNESQLSLAGVESSGMRVVDAPDTAEPGARKKTLVLGAAGGLLAGVTLSLLALIVLMVRDRSLRSEDQVLAAGLHLAGQVPEVQRRKRRKTNERPIEEPARS